MIQCWRLDDSRQTLVLGSTRDRLAEVVYWGARLPDNEGLTTLYEAHAIDVTGGMLDSNPAISVDGADGATATGAVVAWTTTGDDGGRMGTRHSGRT